MWAHLLHSSRDNNKGQQMFLSTRRSPGTVPRAFLGAGVIMNVILQTSKLRLTAVKWLAPVHAWPVRGGAGSHIWAVWPYNTYSQCHTVLQHGHSLVVAQGTKQPDSHGGLGITGETAVELRPNGFVAFFRPSSLKRTFQAKGTLWPMHQGRSVFGPPTGSERYGHWAEVGG